MMNEEHVFSETKTHDSLIREPDERSNGRMTIETNSNEYRSMLIYGVVAFSLALFIRFFIAAPYLVQGASMDPTFHSADYLIVDRLSYRLEEPARGDVIVFRYPQDPSRSFIKRIIGLPGETVDLEGGAVHIINTEHPDGFTIDEKYIAPENMAASTMRVTLGADDYFVLGDNRRASADSRIWGALPRVLITGRAFVRLFPFTQIGINPGETAYHESQ